MIAVATVGRLASCVVVRPAATFGPVLMLHIRRMLAVPSAAVLCMCEEVIHVLYVQKRVACALSCRTVPSTDRTTY